MKNNAKKAEQFFDNHNCCQSVIMACSPQLDITLNQAAKIGAGFGAGMGYQGRTCGAVVGAYMAIGLKAGEQHHNPEALKETTYQVMQQYNKTFVKRFGSTICKELLKVDLSEPAGVEQAKAAGLFDTRCPEFVKGSVEIVEDLFNKYFDEKKE